jgi:Spy/CpxP family protein refolding chaperone
MVTGAMGRSKWIAVAVLLATFLAGGMLGAATSRLLASDRAEQRSRQDGAERRDDRRGGRSIFDRMNLTAEQQAAVDSIMAKRTRDMKTFWEQNGPSMRAIVDSARAEVERVLTPTQLQQYQEFQKRRYHGPREPGTPGWGPPPPPDGKPDGRAPAEKSGKAPPPPDDRAQLSLRQQAKHA